MKVLMQGMRRSGTTIHFDILSRDPRFDLWYEPFSQGKVGALGGGSGIQQVDLMEKIREFRRDFAARWPGGLDPDELNYGAPRDPALELESELPDFCRSYLKEMLAKREHTVIKFTRIYRKVGALHEIAPDARFVQLVRHPREVVCSYMYDKDQRNAPLLPSADAFFTLNDKSNPWNARKFVAEIVARDGLPHLAKVENFKRYLLLWKYTFENTYRDGRKHFGKAFFLLRHEDLLADPRGTTKKLYEHIGLPAPEDTLAWAAANVRKSVKETFAADPRWAAAYRELDMGEALRSAGYESL